MDPAHAAAMLAQMQSGMGPAGKLERAGMNPLAAAAAAACMPQAWGTPFGWHPSLWPGAVNPYVNPLLNPAAAAAMQMNAAVVSQSSVPAMVPSIERTIKSELPKKQRIAPDNELAANKARALEAEKKTSCGPHSGTQRRPLREEFDDDAEYCQAYHRWRQVRDRNNDAVKRSREKYKSKRKSAEPSTTRERELEQKMGSLQCQLVLLARALTGNGTLTPLEQAEVQLVLKATLASIESPMAVAAAGTPSTTEIKAERASPTTCDARVPATDSESAVHTASPLHHSNVGGSSPSSACSSQESDGETA